MILDRSGFTSVPAFNAEDALLLASQSSFDILLTDVMMEPTNGIQLAVAFQAMQPGARIILFSGNEATASLLLGAASTAFNFPVLAKPIDPYLLLDRLRLPAASPVFEK